MLRAGRLSRRAIARTAGISRTTVGKVAAGMVTSAARLRHEDAASQKPLLSQVEPFRCPRCGGMSATFPCAKCYVEAVTEGNRPRTNGNGRVAIGLDLLPEHDRRYREIRRRREAVAADG